MSLSLLPANPKENVTGLSLPFGLDGRIVLLAAVTVFVNAYLCTAVALLAAIYALADGDRRRAMACVPHVRWLIVFAVPALVVPPVYGNWTGLAAAAAILVILVFYLYLRTVMTRELFHAVADLALLISLVYMAVALLQRILGVTPRSPSTFQNANYFSFAMELVIVLAFYRLSTARRFGQRLFITAAILANIFALWTADCRSAWPSVFGGLFILFAMNRKPGNMLALILVFAAGIRLATAFPVVSPRMGSVETAEMTRVGIWMEAVGDILRYPALGVGALGYLHLTASKYMHAHNLLLELLASFGLAGAFLLGTYFLRTFFDHVKGYMRGGDRQLHALAVAAAAVTAIHGLTDVTVMWPQTGMLLALILAGGSVALTPPPSSSPFSA